MAQSDAVHYPDPMPQTLYDLRVWLMDAGYLVVEDIGPVYRLVWNYDLEHVEEMKP